MDFAPDKLRARFAELSEKRDRIRAKADPLREERDSFVQANAAKEAAMNAAIRKAEEGLFELDQEAATIARALGGKTG
jgi:uncharacterized coiled-coil DUF342 family protein